MTKIVHEIPDELELEGEEVEVSLDEGKEAKPEKSTADVERVVQDKSGKPEFDFEIEEEDESEEEPGNAPSKELIDPNVIFLMEKEFGEGNG